MRRDRFVPAYKRRRLEHAARNLWAADLARPAGGSDVVRKFNDWAASSKVAFSESLPGTGR